MATWVPCEHRRSLMPLVADKACSFTREAFRLASTCGIQSSLSPQRLQDHHQHRRKRSEQDGEQKPVQPAPTFALGKAGVDESKCEPTETAGGRSTGMHTPTLGPERPQTLALRTTQPSSSAALSPLMRASVDRPRGLLVVGRGAL